MPRRPNPKTGVSKALDRIHPQIAALWWALTKQERESWDNAKILGSLNRLMGFYWKNLIQWEEHLGFYAAYPAVRHWDNIVIGGQIEHVGRGASYAQISIANPDIMLAIAIIRGQTEWKGLTIPSFKTIHACRGQTQIRLPVTGMPKRTSHIWAKGYGANGQISNEVYLGAIHNQ